MKRRGHLALLLLAALASAPSSAAAPEAPRPAASAAIPYQAERQSESSLALQTGAALLVCAAAGAAVIYLLRHRRSPAGLAAGRHLDVIETRALGPKHALLVVRYDDEQLLLVRSEAGVSLLRHKPLPASSHEGTAS